MTNKKEFNKANTDTYDKIVIAGGGLAAYFTAYEILRKAEEADKQLSVMVVAEQPAHFPVAAGSHLAPEIDGLLTNDVQNVAKIKTCLGEAYEDLGKIIEKEQISCRYAPEGYEYKARTAGELENFIKLQVDQGVYQREDFPDNTNDQKIKIGGHPYSIAVEGSGQINMPELLQGLSGAIKKMGGEVLEGKFLGQERLANNNILVRTSKGDFETTSKPLIATGAKHQRTLPEFAHVDRLEDSMALIVGPLDPEDRKKISATLMCFCNTEFENDQVFGGIDEKGFLTLGTGVIKHPASVEEKEALVERHFGHLKEMFPGLFEKYGSYGPEQENRIHKSWGTAMIPENSMPVVGRSKDYDVMGAWGWIGIVPGLAAAKAMAEYVVNDNDHDLRLFEDMQPSVKWARPENKAKPAGLELAR